MTTPISSLFPTPPTAGQTSGTSGQSSSNPLASLANGNTFLKLLVAQLKNQDPTNPMSPSAMMAQTAQLAQVETMNSVSKSQDQMSQEITALAATNLIGKQVSAADSSGSIVTGMVSGITATANGPLLTIGKSSVSLSSVTSVS